MTTFKENLEARIKTIDHLMNEDIANKELNNYLAGRKDAYKTLLKEYAEGDVSFLDVEI